MRISKLQEVVHIYCDVCGKNITLGTRYGFTGTTGKPIEVCDGWGKHGRSTLNKSALSCREKIKMKIAIESGDRYLQ